MARAKSKKVKQVRSWCTRCRGMKPHIVVSSSGGTPRRVTCKVCDGTHNYRPEAPRSRSRGSPRKVTLDPRVTDWEELMGIVDLDSVRPYAMRRSYVRGDVINHKSFGLGIVIREIDERKMEVSFQDGIRLLVRNFRR